MLAVGVMVMADIYELYYSDAFSNKITGVRRLLPTG